MGPKSVTFRRQIVTLYLLWVVVFTGLYCLLMTSAGKAIQVSSLAQGIGGFTVLWGSMYAFDTWRNARRATRP